MNNDLIPIIAQIPAWAGVENKPVERIAGLIPSVEGFDYLEFAQYLFSHEIRELQRVAII